MKRICIAGPSSAGKSTLSRYISKSNNIPYLHTNGPALRSRYQCKTHKDIVRMSALQPPKGISYQWDLLSERIQLAADNQDFVMDRSMIDNVVYFLLQCSPHTNTEETAKFVMKAVSAIVKFNYLILIPPFYDRVENDGVRIDNTLYQNMTWAMMQYVVKEYFRLPGPLAVKVLTIDTYDFEKRKLMVDQFLSDN